MAYQGAPINTSVGVPYLELRTIARRMNCNGEGMRYMVREAPLVDSRPPSDPTEHVARR